MMKVKTKNIFLVVLAMLFVLTFGCFFVSISAKAQEPAPVTDIVMSEKASVRKQEDKSGIRYTAYVNESNFENGALKDGYKAGVIVTDGQVNANTLTHASNQTGGAYAGRVLDIPTTIWDADKDNENGKAFNAVVWNIPQSEYGEYLTARAYLFNGTEYIYSDAVCVRNVAQVASEALADGVEDTWGTLVKYVDGVNPTVSVDGNAETAIAVEKEVGANLSISITPSYLTPAITTESKFVDITDNKILVRKYDANNTLETVTIKLGSTTKTVQITAKNEFKDGNLAENVLADFDESYYPSYGIKQGAGVTHTYMDVRHFDAESAQNAGVDADSGVVGINVYGSYDAVVVPFGKTLTVSEISGIYIKIWVDETTATKNSVYIKINGNEKKASDAIVTDGVNLVANSWNYICIPNALLMSTKGYQATTISELEMYVQGTPRFWWYIDEVGLMDNLTKDNVLLDFENASDKAMVWGRFVKVSYLMPNDAGYPTGVGADTGVLELPQETDDGNPSQFHFKQLVNTANVSQIVLRMYTPSSSVIGDHRMRVWVNTTAGTRIEVTSSGSPLKVSKVCEGKFADIVVNLSSIASGTVLNSLEIARHWSVNNTTKSSYWIDSITYVAK